MHMRAGWVKRWCVAGLAGLGVTGCDLVAVDGQTLVLGNRGTVYGSGGNAQQAPLPAVRVLPGGAVIVEDADLLGGGIVVESADPPVYGLAGAGIAAEGLLDRARPAPQVRVLNGRVQGGPVVLGALVNLFDAPSPAIDASAADIEIAGGLIRGGAIVSLVPGDAFPAGSSAPAVFALESTLRITGGTFESGAVIPLDPAGDPGPNPTFVAIDSDVEIRAGEFNDGILINGGSARIFGGRGRLLGLASATPDGCSELHGGSFDLLVVLDGRVLAFGTGLAPLET
jgi:hypothetical protein